MPKTDIIIMYQSMDYIYIGVSLCEAIYSGNAYAGLTHRY